MCSLRFSVSKVISSVDRDNFTFSFPIWVSFISLSYLIALVRTSSTMLWRISEVGILFFLLNYNWFTMLSEFGNVSFSSLIFKNLFFYLKDNALQNFVVFCQMDSFTYKGLSSYFLLAYWGCHSTVFWIPLFLKRYKLLILLLLWMLLWVLHLWLF